MARKKSTNPSELLTHLIGVRLSDKTYQRLSDIQQKSDCQSVSELARRILTKEKIACFHIDASMDATMEELTRIRKELNAIGININQVTRSVHNANTTNEKLTRALDIVGPYTKLNPKVDRLLELVSQLTKKWLQK
jgi:hypothetical protein